MAWATEHCPQPRFDPFPPGPSLDLGKPRAACLESQQSAQVVSSAYSLNFDDFGCLAARSDVFAAVAVLTSTGGRKKCLRDRAWGCRQQEHCDDWQQGR